MREHMTRRMNADFANRAEFFEGAGPRNRAEGGPRRGPGGRRGGHPHGGGRMRRGMTRALLLAGLVDGPAHGYELMDRLEEKTGGRWRPSPGSVYPTLTALEEEGLITGRDEDGKRVFELTEAGRDEADTGLFDRVPGPSEGQRDLFNEIRSLMSAAKQVGSVGTPEQVTEATAAVKAARQALYRLLAE